MIWLRDHAGTVRDMEAATQAPTKPEAKAEREAPDCLAGNLGWLLAQAYYGFANEVRAAFDPLGVSARGYHVLAAALDGEFTQIELAHLLGLDKTTMVVTIDELEEAGLAERRPSAKDRRARVLKVTKAGERMVAKGDEVLDRIQAEVLSTLPAAQRKDFLEALVTLVKDRFSGPSPCAKPLRRRA
jgi:MarR family transcriptional regulator for hemolysin